MVSRDPDDEYPTRPGARRHQPSDPPELLGKLMRRVATHDQEIPDLQTDMRALADEMRDFRIELGDIRREFKADRSAEMRIVSRVSANRSAALMGLLSTLLSILWHVLEHHK